ncbi:MAG: putative membrane protein [Rhodobacteraceae bacterium HLUCCA12]|nr:MAG: putative membrane protein [Rhodobacteraceae bacterium HLUCCA12]
MGGWLEFIAALAVFFLSHAVPVRPAVKGAIVTRFGAPAFTIGYSLLSLAILAWLIVAAGRAPFVALWFYAPWQAWLALGGMALACVLAAVALVSVNPFSFGGRAGQFDPDAPGIAGVVRHPLLLAILLWAGVHLLANGTLAHVILFALFAGFALVGMVMLDRRRQREMGRRQWREQARATSLLPLAALFTGRWRPRRGPPWGAVAVGLLAWAALITLHPWVIGPSPLP